MSALNVYCAALERLKANKPTALPKDFAINNDTVALEAGRKRGSIKKSRHAALIEAIELGRVPNLKKSLYLIKYTSYFLKYEVHS